MKIEIENKIKIFLEEIKSTEYFSKIEFIVLYGSYLSKYYLEDSDVDICLYIQDDKKNLSKIRLDLLTKFDHTFDIQIYQLLPIYIQVKVLKGKFLYIKNKSKAYEKIEEYEDFLPIYLDYINH
ncbi:MAG: nucleotidyltransferase domain-containing protein [Promethearchaeota archaeon]|nr:MAG: nucleotidyltransferase domain-containing protein [Candidatus Lokiarchaeota archaeon]